MIVVKTKEELERAVAISNANIMVDADISGWCHGKNSPLYIMGGRITFVNDSLKHFDFYDIPQILEAQNEKISQLERRLADYEQDEVADDVYEQDDEVAFSVGDKVKFCGGKRLGKYFTKKYYTVEAVIQKKDGCFITLEEEVVKLYRDASLFELVDDTEDDTEDEQPEWKGGDLVLLRDFTDDYGDPIEIALVVSDEPDEDGEIEVYCAYTLSDAAYIKPENIKKVITLEEIKEMFND
jgi:hypothetical protein